MDEDSLKNKVMNLEYELVAIKLLKSDCVDDVTRLGPSATGGESNAKAEFVDSMKNAFQHFFSEHRPVPIRFFREEHREVFMEALRAHRMSLLRAPKKEKIVAKNLPHVAEYYAELYGTTDSIIFKVGKILEFVSKIERDADDDNRYLADSFDNKEAFDDFNLLKTELGDAQRFMMSAVNQFVQTHRLVAETFDNIAKETQKRYESEEIYSDDGSMIIVSTDEKYHANRLNPIVNEFSAQKSVLLENLAKLMKSAANLYELKSKLNAKLKIVLDKTTSTESKSSKRVKPKIIIGKVTLH